MLVHGREDSRCDLRCVAVRRPGEARPDEDDAGGLGLDLDRAVEVEVPVEAVVVVADRGEVRHDESSGAAHIGTDPGLRVLPEDAVVLLVHADDVGDLHGMTLIVGDIAVEVADHPEAVAAQFEVVRVLAELVLARVEIADPEARGRGVAVGDDHLRDAAAGEHRATVERHRAQHEALAGVEPDAHRPLLPLDEGAVDVEARALGLGDLDGLEALAGRAHGIRRVFPARRRNGSVALVLDADHPVLGEIDMHDQALDGVRPWVVVLGVLQERERADDPASDLIGATGVARGERGAEREGDLVLESSPEHRARHSGEAFARPGCPVVLLEQILRLAVGGEGVVGRRCSSTLPR